MTEKKYIDSSNILQIYEIAAMDCFSEFRIKLYGLKCDLCGERFGRHHANRCSIYKDGVFTSKSDKSAELYKEFIAAFAAKRLAGIAVRKIPWAI
jgi:hypothetical protein